MQRSPTICTGSRLLVILPCLLWPCLLGVVGCFSQRETMRNLKPNQEVKHDAELPVIDELVRSQSSIAKPLRIVIYDFPSLSQLPLLDLKVDFTTQMVLLAAMGSASSEQCQIQIERVWRDGDQLRVSIHEAYPPADAHRRSEVASPFHAVVVPRSELPIVGFTSRIPSSAFLK